MCGEGGTAVRAEAAPPAAISRDWPPACNVFLQVRVAYLPRASGGTRGSPPAPAAGRWAAHQAAATHASAAAVKAGTWAGSAGAALQAPVRRRRRQPQRRHRSVPQNPERTCLSPSGIVIRHSKIVLNQPGGGCCHGASPEGSWGALPRGAAALARLRLMPDAVAGQETVPGRCCCRSTCLAEHRSSFACPRCQLTLQWPLVCTEAVAGAPFAALHAAATLSCCSGRHSPRSRHTRDHHIP